VTRNRRTNVTRNMLADQLTVEKLFHDCLDVRFLRRKGFFDCGSATLGPSLKWPVPLMRIARYLLILKSQGTMLEAGLSTRMGEMSERNNCPVVS
jgi:hypothetical protein